MKTSEILKTLRKAKGYSTMLAFCSKFGISFSTYQNYESGKRIPTAEVLIKLSNFYNVSVDYILGLEKSNAIENGLTEVEQLTLKEIETKLVEKYLQLDEKQRSVVKSFIKLVKDETPDFVNIALPEKRTITLRYVNLAEAAEIDDFLSDKFIEEHTFEYTPEAEYADIVIPVNGDSMEPLYGDGANLLVKLQSSVDIGDIGVFILDGSGYIKRLGDGRLISENKSYRDMYLKKYESVRCIGKVIGTIKG